MCPRQRKVIAPEVLFEDAWILVLNKPAGLVVNRAQTTDGNTLQDWLEKYLSLKDEGVGGRAGIVHRLDKETSGVLLIAKDLDSFVNLQSQFKNRKVKKTYLALVHGQMKPKGGVIRAPVTRSPFNRKKFGVFLGGREAETAYEVLKFLKNSSGKEFSLVELKPLTGRTHQIRVHMKYLGYPVVGDAFYAGRKTYRADQKWCFRQFLHAQAILFRHPKSQKKLVFKSALPKDLSQALKTLK